MTALKTSVLLAAVALTSLVVAGCNDQETASGEGTTSAESTPHRTPTHDASEHAGAPLDIQLTIEGTQLRGTLDDTPAGRDFASMLPLTLTLTDFHDTEKISDLPRRLTTTEDEVPDETAGTPGDLAIYAPWGNLAIFYRDFTYTDDLVRLGSLEPGAATAISRIEDGTTVTIESTD